MSKIERIRAEIDRRYNEYSAKKKTDDFIYYSGMADALDLFEQFIDTLEEESDKNLVEEVKRYYSDNFAYISSDQPTLSILTNVARHFAEWQKKQMLKDAVEGEYDQYPAAIYLSVPIPRMNQGDKVRIIIVKED